MAASKRPAKPRKSRESVDPADKWCGQVVRRGERKTVAMTVSQTYSGADIQIPVVVWRAAKPGPTLAVTGAVHGDEINGSGAIRRIIMDPPFELLAGTMVMVPVVNIFGFERFTRYLPDRRDLNRCFPGSKRGSLAGRLARTVFDSVIGRADYLIDLHSAAVRRTNFPNVRADMTDPTLAAFARAFGSELIVSSRGPRGSLRSAGAAAGCHCLILEAGEVWKVESAAIDYAIRGIRNCLTHLEMVDGTISEPAYRIETDATAWIRANRGGFLSFHVAPGDSVVAGQVMATNTDFVGNQRNLIKAPREGVILGMTTHPAVAPGDPIFHIAFARSREMKRLERAVGRMDEDALHERARDDFATNINVTAIEDGSKDV